MIEHLWMTYHRQLLFFIRRRISDPSLADDILQEVFIKAYSKYEHLDDFEKAKAWLYQICRNAIIDHYRQSTFHESVELDGHANHLQSPNENSFEVSSCVLPKIFTLPENYKEVIYLSEIKGMTQKQVAEKLNLSYTASKSRVQRGRKLLKEALKQCCQVQHNSKGEIVDIEKKMEFCPTCR